MRVLIIPFCCTDNEKLEEKGKTKMHKRKRKHKKMKGTSWAGSATLGDTWSSRIRWGDTAHSKLGHLVRGSKWADTAYSNWAYIWTDFQTRVGTPHIPIEVIWSDVQTRVGMLHKVLRCFGSRGGKTAHSIWGYLVRYSNKKIYMVGWVVSFRKYSHFVASSFKLGLARFSA